MEAFQCDRCKKLVNGFPETSVFVRETTREKGVLDSQYYISYSISLAGLNNNKIDICAKCQAFLLRLGADKLEEGE